MNGTVSDGKLGEWKISFDVPNKEWFAYQPYSNSGFGKTAALTDDRVWLQTLDSPVLPQGYKINNSLTYDDSGEWVFIDASYYPPNADPPNASVLQRMGNKDIWVMKRKKGSDLYYWKGENGLYEMYFYKGDKTALLPEQIFSAIKEVK